MNGLQPWYARVVLYCVVFATIGQFIVLVFTDSPIPKWSYLGTLALLTMFAGEESHRQWKLARQNRAVQRIQDQYRQDLRDGKTVTVIKVRKIDGNDKK